MNTSEADLALGALGLPLLGSAWSTNIPNLLVSSRKTSPIGGRDDNNRRGHTLVELEYADPTWSDAVLPQVDYAYSTVTTSTQTLQVIADAAGNATPPLSREKNLMEIRVTAYKSSFGAIASFVNILNKINSNPVTFPPIRGFADGVVTAAAGQLLARGFELREKRTGVCEITYTFGYGPTNSFRAEYRNQDADGNATGPVIYADVQGSIAYPSAGVLW